MSHIVVDLWYLCSLEEHAGAPQWAWAYAVLLGSSGLRWRTRPPRMVHKDPQQKTDEGGGWHWPVQDPGLEGGVDGGPISEYSVAPLHQQVSCHTGEGDCGWGWQWGAMTAKTWGYGMSACSKGRNWSWLGRLSHTHTPVSQLSADDLSITISPTIVTDCAPLSRHVELHPTFPGALASHQPYRHTWITEVQSIRKQLYNWAHLFPSNPDKAGRFVWEIGPVSSCFILRMTNMNICVLSRMQPFVSGGESCHWQRTHSLGRSLSVSVKLFSGHGCICDCYFSSDTRDSAIKAWENTQEDGDLNWDYTVGMFTTFDCERNARAG